MYKYAYVLYLVAILGLSGQRETIVYIQIYVRGDYKDCIMQVYLDGSVS